MSHKKRHKAKEIGAKGNSGWWGGASRPRNKVQFVGVATHFSAPLLSCPPRKPQQRGLSNFCSLSPQHFSFHFGKIILLSELLPADQVEDGCCSQIQLTWRAMILLFKKLHSQKQGWGNFTVSYFGSINRTHVVCHQRFGAATTCPQPAVNTCKNFKRVWRG